MSGASSRIAVIGLAGRFPGTEGIEPYWESLAAGREGITFFSEEELRSAGAPASLLADPAYVRARGLLAGADLFDAAFFGLSPREADVLDPQHRLLLECAWQALERAGYDPRRYPGLVGVFAGAGSNTYLLFNLARNRKVVDAVGFYQAMLGSDGDFLATRISYKLGLKGPSLTVQTACSTSLVAVHLACRALLAGECDMALAGGVRVSVPQRAGYLHQPGGIFSPDGHCRPFDAAAQGCLDGDGVGIVVLKRLDEAVADGDHVQAVILGSAINNDGSDKVGYTAPSEEGQAEVIALAQALAGVDASTIDYVEAHGTATPMGDPIEVAALRQVFAGIAQRSCALGSVKSNIGHLDAAAGIASLIKAVLALEHRQIPPTLHFERPNPETRLEESPFYVSSRLVEWPARSHPRRAGVSSFGIGGTNAHVVLEEAPEVPPGDPTRSHQLLVLSAATESALETATIDLIEHLRRHLDLSFADLAHTLQVGRKILPQRRMLVCADATDAIAALAALDPRRALTRVEEATDRPVVFLFPGQGAQYPGMAKRLYGDERSFREQIDRCAEILRHRHGLDLLATLYPAERGPEAAERLKQTSIAQPAIFAVEYALAQLWMAWGVAPQAMIGHSVGEYVAACLAGVFSLEDALAVVAARSRLMQEMPAGAMVSVSLPEAELRPLLTHDVEIAAINAPSLCVASGPLEAVAALAAKLGERGMACQPLHTSHAFHSASMEPILERFITAFAGVRLQPPAIPFVSNVTGAWIRSVEAIDPAYWARHLRQTVRFSDGAERLFERGAAALLEVGPGRALSSLVRQHPRRPSGQLVLSSLPAAPDGEGDLPVLLRALGQLWLAGVAVDWRGFYAHERRRRAVLPTYPFERRRHWVEPAAGERAETPAAALERPEGRRDDVENLTWVPLWKQALPPRAATSSDDAGFWLLFLDEAGVGERLAERLRERGKRVAVVRPGARFGEMAPGCFEVRPCDADDHTALLERLAGSGGPLRWIVHLWNVAPFLAAEEASFFSLLALAQALGRRGAPGALHLSILSTGLQRVGGEDEADPARALLLGLVSTIPLELPRVTCRSIDLALPAPGGACEWELVGHLLVELETPASETVVAYRGAERWVRIFEPLRLDTPASPDALPLRERGTYLITGGLGGVGLEIAGLLARTVQARLVVTSRSGVVRDPARLREMEAAGAEVLALAADVTSPASMAAALAAARERFGALHGVIHAAAVPGSGVMQLTSAEAAAAVLAPKVRGALVLEQLLAGEPLDFFVLCSSLSSLLGGPGQADYAAANAFLDAFARSRSRSGSLRVVSIGWDTWRGIGMAAAPTGGRAGWEDQTAGGDLPPQLQALAHPLLRERDVRGEEEVFLSRFRPGETWILDEHRLGGHPVVPGTAYLEMAGTAFRRMGGDGALEMRDVLFVAPLRVGDGETKEVRTVLRHGDDGCRFRIASRESRAGTEWQEHAVGTILPAAPAAPARLDLARLRGDAQNEQTLGEEYREDLRNAGLGPRWESLKKVWAGDGWVLGLLELAPEFAADVEAFELHPALLDIGTSFGEVYAPRGEGHYLPLSYKRLVVHGPLPRRAWSYVRFRGSGHATGETIAFDITLLGDDGVERVRAEEFVLKRVDVALAIRGHAEQGRVAEPPPEEDGEGTTPAEALELFRRILAGPRLPQVAVSRLPLPQALERLRRLAARPARSLSGGHARPDVSTPYLAPRNDLERRLASIWQEVLGIEAVGSLDNFFELGGHSLLGTQLLSRLRNELQVELSLPRLFEAPVLADLALLIQAERGRAGAVAASTIQIVPRNDDLPLSFAQERLWFLDQLDPGNPFYNISQAVRLEGALDFALLARSLQEITGRHELLRTAFVSVGGQPLQRVLPAVRATLLLVDLSALPQERREAEAERLVPRAAERCFDLTRPPLFATCVLRLSPQQHLCVLTMHHIVSDGWSIGVLVAELTALYRAVASSEPSPLAPLPIQYADFATWQRGWLEQETVERQVAYWRNQLAGPLPILDLPTDRPRPAVQSFRGASETVGLPVDLTSRLKALCAREGATPFMALLAAFASLLHRWSGQTDILVGSPIAGRNRRELEELIGVFLNTLALRVDLSGSPSFRELLRRVRGMVLAAYAHQDVPVEMLLQELKPERDLSRTSLFQVLFNMQDFPRRRFELPELTLTTLPIREVPSKFDLTVYAAEVEDEILFELIYNADLFVPARMVEMLAQLVQVLTLVVEDPERRIGDVSLVTPRARTLLPDPTAELSAEWMGSVQGRFVENALRQPGRLAAVDTHGGATYGELLALSSRVARYLAAGGIGRGEVVALYAHRSLALVAAILGVLRSGAAVLVLDPAYPGARLRQYLELARARGWIAIAAAGEPPAEVRAYADRLPASCRLVLAWDLDGGQALAGFSAGDPGVEVGPDDLAVVSFTSGSTGVPKGVLGRHGPLSHHLPWHCRTFGLSADDRFSMLSALAHDPLQRDVFTPLWLGAAICIPDPDDIGAPGRLAEWMARLGVTVAHLTPAMSQLVCDPVPQWIEAAGGLRSLRRAFLVGEALTRRDVARLRRLAPEVVCVNLYGSTETQRSVAFHVADDLPEESARAVLPLGRGIEDVQLVVLNPAGALAGVGERGEIHVRSPHLARGYLSGSDADRARFFVNPFTGRPGDRVYRTGDLGCYRPDGEVEFLGRVDHEVKVRGFRVDLGEVEATLAAHPALREAVVLAREGPEGRRLAAWLVPVAAERPEVAELRRYVRERLPEYMVPAAWRWLERLPLTPNGKLDRRALPEPVLGGHRPSAELPHDQLEELIAGIWADLLRLERVGTHESFFDLGGHSLLAAQAVARISAALGVELPLRRLFEAPTVAGIARAVAKARAAGAERGLLPLRRRAQAEEPVLSFAQQRLWFLQQLEPENPFYNNSAAVALDGSLQVVALRRTLSEVVRRHEVLRSTYPSMGGRPMPRVAPPAPVPLPVVDLRYFPPEAREREARRLAAAEALRPFDLVHGPVLRFLLLRLAADEHIVLYAVHHIASDAWSNAVLVGEIAAIYAAFCDGRPSPLPEPIVQYADYARWQREWLQGDVLEEQLAYWRGALGGAPPVLRLATDRQRTGRPSYQGLSRSCRLPHDLAQALQALSRREGTTLFMTLLAAFGALLRSHADQDDIVIGTAVATRGRTELEGLLGLFVNMVPLRLDFSGNPRFVDLLRRVREVSLGAFAHQDVPLERLVEELRPDAERDGSALFRVAFGVRNSPADELKAPGLSIRPVELRQETARFDLTVWVSQVKDGLQVTWVFSSDLFAEETIERMQRRFESLARSAVAAPEARIGSLDLLSTEEKQRRAREDQSWHEEQASKLTTIRQRRSAAAVA